MLHTHAIIVVGAEPPSAVVTPRKDADKKAPRMDGTDETGQRECKPMTNNNRKKSKSANGPPERSQN